MNIVLVEPEIPPNTGNVARLCCASKATLHLIEQFGSKLDGAQLKRAGMDYWKHVRWLRWANWAAYRRATLPVFGGISGSTRTMFIQVLAARLPACPSGY